MNLQHFFSFSLELYSIISFSHTLVHLEKHWSIFGACLEHSSFHQNWRNKEKESKKVKGDNGIDYYSGFSLQVPSCMYDFHASFGMHGICMCLFGYDLSLAQRIAQIDSDFRSLVISQIAMVFLDCPLIVFDWCSSSIWLRVELLVPRAIGWNKHSRPMEQIGLSYQSWSLSWINSLEPLVG